MWADFRKSSFDVSFPLKGIYLQEIFLKYYAFFSFEGVFQRGYFYFKSILTTYLKDITWKRASKAPTKALVANKFLVQRLRRILYQFFKIHYLQLHIHLQQKGMIVSNVCDNSFCFLCAVRLVTHVYVYMKSTTTVITLVFDIFYKPFNIYIAFFKNVSFCFPVLHFVII